MILDKPFDQAIRVAAATLVQASSDIKNRALLYVDWIGSKIGHLIFAQPTRLRSRPPHPKLLYGA